MTVSKDEKKNGILNNRFIPSGKPGRNSESSREVLEKYKFMVESAYDAIYYKDLDSRYLFANTKTLQAFGLTRKEVIGKNDYELMINKEEARVNVDDDKHVFETGNSKEIIKHMTSSNGKDYWFQAIKIPHHDDDGKVIGLIGFARDITERKNIEDALIASEKRYRDLVERAGIAIAIADKNGLFTFYNKRFEEIFGYGVKEIKDIHIKDIVHADDLKWVMSYHSSRIQGGKPPTRYEFKAVRKDGSILYVEVVIDVIKSKNDIIATHSYLWDITERKALERNIIEISSSERRRIGTVLHDSLGQKLTGIAFYCKSLEQTLKNKSMPETLQVKRIAKHVNEAIAEVRNLAKGLSPVGLDTVDIISVLKGLTSDSQTIFNISCRFQYDESIGFDDTSIATHLYYIAQEAIINAVKHGKAKKVVINLQKLYNQVALCIDDDGIGVPDNISECFGMGIRIMKYRSELIGGDFSIEKSREKGTIVSCKLPNQIMRLL